MNNRDSLPRGFTLIEILVALAIIAIAMGAVIKASSNHTYSVTKLKQKTLAHYVAMNEIIKLETAGKLPDYGTHKKSTEMAGREWFWNREVIKMLHPLTGKPTPLIRQVSFTIYEDENRRNNITRLVSYLASPPGLASPGSAESGGGE